jgi:phosphatidylethanolamine-binding protein (PEBP) family uncharacterized protein
MEQSCDMQVNFVPIVLNAKSWRARCLRQKQHCSVTRAQNLVLIVPMALRRIVDEFPSPLTFHLRFSVRDGESREEDSVVQTNSVLTPTKGEQCPTLQFSQPLNPDNMYTVILSDPDAPSPSDPKFAEWQHWVWTNATVRGAADLCALDPATSSGDHPTAWFGPAPGQGDAHTYCVVVYQQPVGHNVVVPQEQWVSAVSGFPPRRSFNSRAFAAAHGLVPVAALTFVCGWDERVPLLAARLQGQSPP